MLLAKKELVGMLMLASIPQYSLTVNLKLQTGPTSLCYNTNWQAAPPSS